MNTESQWSKQEACFAQGAQVWPLSITTPVSLLADELMFEVYCTGVRLAAVNQICVIHEAMNGFINLKVH